VFKETTSHHGACAERGAVSLSFILNIACSKDRTLTFSKLDKLITSQLGQLAQRRLARGLKLNHAEATVCSIHLLLKALLKPKGANRK